MSTEELHTKFNRRIRSTTLFVWLAAAAVFLFLLLVAPHTNDPDFVRALAVGWPILLALVAAWRLGGDPRRAYSRRVASVSGDDATYYVEKHERGWRVTCDDAPIGLLKDAGDATRFACDIARMQAQIGRVTWVIVLAEVEEVHRFETRAQPDRPRRSAVW
jgi:hypothetical protein